MQYRLIPLIIGLLFTFPALSQKSLNQLFQEGKQAYEKKDYPDFLDKMRAVDEKRPNYPAVVYQLAKAYALNGRKTRSIQKLRQLILMDATRDFEKDPDLESIKGYKGYDEVKVLKKTLSEIEENDEVFRIINTGGLHPESFVILDNGDILLGSIREKKIVKVDLSGNITDWAETPYSVLGMHADFEAGHLWVASAAMPEMIGYQPSDKGNSYLLKIDLETGGIIQGMHFDEESMIGDVVFDQESHLWFSNSMVPLLSRDCMDTTFLTGAFVRLQFDLRDTHFNLQGLTLSDDERFVYFSDYISGIYRVTIKGQEVEEVFSTKDILLKGIDGLYYYQNSLIAVHNGVKPYRVTQYQLNEAGIHITHQKVINRGGESLGEPTLGQIKDGYFYYLANSPWGAYDQRKNFLLDKVRPLEIRRYKLD